jgi:ATP-dependent Lhr-like helicase
LHEVVRKLAGFEAPASEWELALLRARLRDFRPETLDHLTLTGEVVWGRLWGAGDSPIRSTPTCLMLREDIDMWKSLAALKAGDGPLLDLRVNDARRPRPARRQLHAGSSEPPVSSLRTSRWA